MAAPAKLLRARTTFLIAAKKGVAKRFVREGEILGSTDPAVKGRADLFEPVEVHAARRAAARVVVATPPAAPEAE